MQVGEACDHGCELVDDDHEPGKRVCGKVLDGADLRLGEGPLPVAQFGAQAGECPTGGGLIEIGDESDAVRQVRERGE